MSELQPPPPPPPPPPLGSINGLVLGSREGITTTTTTITTTAAATVGIPLSSDRQLQQQQSLGTKRQRRPSVRLGDIGDHNQTAATTHSYESYLRRTTKQQWKDHNSNTHNNFSYRHPSHFLKDPKSSKTRPLTNLTNTEETFDGGDGKLNKPRRSGVKRVRSNWVSNDGIRDLDDNSDTPLKELGVTSPIQSIEENPRKQIRGSRIGESDGDDDDDNDETPRFIIEDGVQNWLNGLGLGRYGPVFEIHEVDEEVLPLLTLDDLKDMGINAVGSRRKLFCAIQKLAKGFS